MIINEKQLKISNSAISIPEELKLGERYKLITDIDIVSTSDNDNHDGTINRVYRGKSIGEVLIEHKGHVVKAKNKSRYSRKLHGAIWHLAQEQDKDFDRFYEEMMQNIIINLPEIFQLIKK